MPDYNQVKFPSVPVTQSTIAPLQQQQKRKTRFYYPQRLWVKLFVPAAILVVTAAGILYYWQARESNSPTIPQAVASKALFQVYVPSQLPGSFIFNTKRFAFTNSAIIAYAADKSGAQLAMSETALPSNLNIQTVFGASLTDERRIIGPTNLTVTGNLSNGEKLLSVTTPTTWIIFTYRVNFSDADLKALSNNLVIQR